MKNKEALENFNETAAMLKETVKPLCDSFHSLVNYKPKEELLYFTLPIVLLVLAARSGEKCWLKMNAFLSLVYGGIMIFNPKLMLSVVYSSELDSGMRLMSTLYGAYQIGTIFFPMFLLHSKDKSIFISYYWSKVIENYLIVVDNIITYQSGLRYNFKLLCYSTSSSVCVGILMLYFLTKTNHKRSQFHFKLFQVNRIAKIDFFLLLSSGIMMLGYPSTVLDNFKIVNQHEGHQMICKICGIIVFALCFQSFCCPSFLFEKDKRDFFLARISFWFMEILAGLYAHFCLKALPKSALPAYFGAATVYGAVLCYGLYLCQAQLAEYQHQVDVSIMESEASFNVSRNEEDEPSDISLSDKKNE